MIRRRRIANKVNLLKIKDIIKTRGITKEHTNRCKYLLIKKKGKLKDAQVFFGKYLGYKLSNIYFYDPGYLQFIIKNGFPIDLKDAARAILKLNNDYGLDGNSGYMNDFQEDVENYVDDYEGGEGI